MKETPFHQCLPCFRRNIADQFNSLGGKLRSQARIAGDISAWSGEGVDIAIRTSRGSYPNPWLCRNARGSDGRVRQELAAGIKLCAAADVRALPAALFRQICDGHHRQRLNNCYAWKVSQNLGGFHDDQKHNRRRCLRVCRRVCHSECQGSAE
jgi:hypothetical protein